MQTIGQFPIQRFKMSTNLLVTLCDNKYKDIWLNTDNVNNTKALIYKGSFMDCVEYLYGFIPEVLKEYCKQFGIVVYTDTKRVGNLSIMSSVFNCGVLGAEEYNLLKKVFLVRGELIHSTLWDSNQYYTKLSWIVDQLMYSDLKKLCDFIMMLCSKINSSYSEEGSKLLIVKPNKENPFNRVRNSKVWSS